MWKVFKRSYWESSYIDLWSVGHFLTGACFGFAPLFFDISIRSATYWFIFGAIMWEVLEYVNGGIEKNLSNVFSDVVVGTAGFFFSWYVFPYFTPNHIFESFLVVLVITLLVQSLSWYQVYYHRMSIRNKGGHPSKLLTTKLWNAIKRVLKNNSK